MLNKHDRATLPTLAASTLLDRPSRIALTGLLGAAVRAP